jgi:hypothetical protein
MIRSPWFAACVQGAELGIYGDFLFSDVTQGGHRGPFASAVGPVGGLVEEALNLTQGNLVQYAQGKDTRFGAELVRAARANIPFMNLWYAKAALDHLIWNQAAEYLSPGYLSTVRSRARREYGQEYFWAPGDASPNRGPDLSKLVE